MPHPPRSVLPTLCLIGLLCGLSGRVAAQADQPNVLFLICDDLNCDISSYGHSMVKTPNLDRLADRGVQFNRAYCQYPLCGPSRASFLSGLYPDQTLIHRNAIHIRERVPNVLTMPQLFRKAGYVATRVGKLYHYNVPKHIGSAGHDDPYSWSYTINPRGRDRNEESKIFSLVPGSFGGTLSWLAADGSDEEQTDGIAATETVKLLEHYAKSQQPFFLAVGLYRPHTPFVAPKKYFEMYPLDEIEVPTTPPDYLESLPAPARNSINRKKDQRNLADDLARQAIQAYYASITFADAQLGRILQALEAEGLDDNTIVLFTSDHGYHMGEHGHWQKTTLFENATRVPLIIAGPGVTAGGQKTEAPAEMVDFYRTLADLCGLEPPEYVSGLSLRPVLQDVESRPRDSALSQLNSGYSLRTDRFRYTEWGEEGEQGAELYDHQSDPQELENLAGSADYVADVERLADALHTRISEAVRPPEGITQNRVEIKRNYLQIND